MRIGLLFPSIYASQALYPDKIFAPRELFIDLVNGLVDRGHEVTVYSVPDLQTKAKLVSESLDCVARPLPYSKFRGVDPAQRVVIEQEFAKHHFELRLIERAFAAAHREAHDVLHVYHDSAMFMSHYFDDLSHDVPAVYTLHDPLPPGGTFEYEELAHFASHNYVSISDSYRQSDLKLNFVATIYHGINVADYPANSSPVDHFLFLGRLVPEKGLHHAVAAVNKTGDKLVVSVNLPREGEINSYFTETVKPLMQGADSQVTFLPVVDKKHRIELYGQAKAFLFPIEWEEPFGVVLIEAMATGTPVVAYNRGSVAEIVKDGVTGFIVDPDDSPRPGKGTWIVKKQGIEGLSEAMGRVSEIKRDACRAHIQESFSAERMVENYEHVYQQLLKK